MQFHWIFTTFSSCGGKKNIEAKVILGQENKTENKNVSKIR